MTKHIFLQTLLVAALGSTSAAQAQEPVIHVYKDAHCGCCTEWISHLEKNGFTVNADNVADTAVYRKKFRIPHALGSCHSATVNGYAVEGHVPARDIKRLLAEKPKARGLAVPGMPLGSPGMESNRNEAYDVLLIDSKGRTSTYQHYQGN